MIDPEAQERIYNEERAVTSEEIVYGCRKNGQICTNQETDVI